MQTRSIYWMIASVIAKTTTQMRARLGAMKRFTGGPEGEWGIAAACGCSRNRVKRTARQSNVEPFFPGKEFAPGRVGVKVDIFAVAATPMKICRFKLGTSDVRIGAVLDDAPARVADLTPAGITKLSTVLESSDAVATVRSALAKTDSRLALADVTLCAPVEQQEIWAAGVTYLRSKTARMEESDFSATAYDRVYAAPRPELFFKSIAEKVAATEELVGIRRDARWNVPEPELALVFNSQGQVVGYTIGNDMSSRDIEGENLLYLPQAKVYDRSCALGPWITLGATEATVRTWQISIVIRRGIRTEFSGETSVGQLKRSFGELGEYLFRSQSFPHGAVLLTGTGVVPTESFTLQSGDEIEIEISGIGRLRNRTAVV
jgi:2-dehydro-3-deoxy-D-arabinonate dehydratase